jgi:anaerobic magnesium-protoporphyrin IX monomethyl ester cyclase
MPQDASLARAARAYTVALVIPPDPPGLNNFNQIPIGALYTAGELIAAGYEACFYDLRAWPDPAASYPAIADADLAVVLSNDYDLAQCYPSLRPAANCISALKAAGCAKVACAGSHATINPETTQRFTNADCVISGEVEFAVTGLATWMASGGTLPRAWPATGQFTATEAQLATLGSPAYHLAPMAHYESEGFVNGSLDRVRSGLVLANRGCPFACSFCYLLFGRRLRHRPVPATLAELRSLNHDYGIRHFFFLDYTFTVDQRWVKEICTAIRAWGADISWVCQTRVDCLSHSVLAEMRQAGCDGIWLGVESPELDQRRYLSKGGIGNDEIVTAVRMIRQHGMNVLAFVMVGLPNETESSLRRLNSWLDQEEAYYSISTFRSRPGTPLAPHGVDSWEQLDAATEYLGESQLKISDLDWFFDYHQKSSRRVRNIMAQRAAVVERAGQVPNA